MPVSLDWVSGLPAAALEWDELVDARPCHDAGEFSEERVNEAAVNQKLALEVGGRRAQVVAEGVVAEGEQLVLIRIDILAARR